MIEQKVKNFQDLYGQSYKHFYEDADSVKQNIFEKPMMTQISKLSKYLRCLFSNELQQKEIINKIDKIIQDCQEDSIEDQKILIFQQIFNQYHKTEKLKIEKNLLWANKLSSKKQDICKVEQSRFSKATTFVSQLVILSALPSKHCEIINLTVQLLDYITTINILNQVNNQQDHLHRFYHPADNGVFGQIFIIQSQTQNYAIKCIKCRIDQKDKQFQQDIFWRVDILKNVLTQYFFVLLFSELQIGPKAKQIVGFDIVFSNDCIQFSTQACYKKGINNQKDQIQMKQSLKMMHALKIVHRDIKYQNLMYSQTFKKQVFIDFGCGIVLNQPICIKSKTLFAGTLAYCSKEMFEVYNGSLKYINLYCNDSHCLEKLIKSNQKLSINTDLKLQISQKILNQDIDQISEMQVLLKKFIFYVFQKDQITYMKIWKKLNLKFNVLIQNALIYVSKFLKEFISTYQVLNVLNRIPQLKEYFTFSDIKNVGMDRFLQRWQLKCPIKVGLFKQKQIVYRIFQLKYGNIKKQQKQYYFTIANRKMIENRLQMMKQEVNFQKIQPHIQFAAYYCLLVLNYCSLHHNNYNLTISEKNKICQETIFLLQKWNINVYQMTFFKCEFKQFTQMSIFFQFFIIKVWNNLKIQFKQHAMHFILLNLFLLGYPMINKQAKTQRDFLSAYFIPKNESQLIQIYYCWSFIKCYINFAKRSHNQTSLDQYQKIKFNFSQQNKLIAQNGFLYLQELHKNADEKLYYFYFHDQKYQINKNIQLLYQKIKSFDSEDTFNRQCNISNKQQDISSLSLNMSSKQCNIQKQIFLLIFDISIILFPPKRNELDKFIPLFQSKNLFRKNFNDNLNQWSLVYIFENGGFVQKILDKFEEFFQKILSQINYSPICSIYFEKFYLYKAFKQKNTTFLSSFINSTLQDKKRYKVQNLQNYNRAIYHFYFYTIINRRLSSQQDYIMIIFQKVNQFIDNVLDRILLNLYNDQDVFRNQSLLIFNESINVLLAVAFFLSSQKQFYFLINMVNKQKNNLVSIGQLNKSTSQNSNGSQIFFFQNILEINKLTEKTNLVRQKLIKFYQRLYKKNKFSIKASFALKIKLISIDINLKNNIIQQGLNLKIYNILYELRYYHSAKYRQIINTYIYKQANQFKQIVVIKIFLKLSTEQNISRGVYNHQINQIYLQYMLYQIQNGQAQCMLNDQLNLVLALLFYKNKDYIKIKKYILKIIQYVKRSGCYVQFNPQLFFQNYCKMVSKAQKINFIQYLVQKISQFSCVKDAQMGFIFYYCTINNQIRDQAKNKCLKFFYKALPYMNASFLSLIIDDLYSNKVKLNQQMIQNITNIPKKDTQQIKKMICKSNKAINRNKLKKMYSKQINKSVYLVEKDLKLSRLLYNNRKDSKTQKTLKQNVNLHFIYRKVLYIQWILPQTIFDLYNRKLNKFHQLKI